MNPRPSPYQGVSIDWDLFKEWLSKEYKENTARDRLSYAKRYYRCLRGDLKPLMILSDDKRLHALKALSALSKFLGIHEYWRLLVKNHGLKWSSGRGDDLIIARLTRTVNDEEIIDWIRRVKAIAPDHAAFLDLMAATGLRFEEAINSWNLIIRLEGENRLGEY